MFCDTLSGVAEVMTGHEAVAETAHESGIHIALAAEKLGHFFGIPITNTLITSWAVIALLVGVSLFVGFGARMIPGRLQTLLELVFGFVYDYIAETLGSRELARRFFPLLMTIFLFVFTANALEFTPGIGSFTYHTSHGDLPLLRSVNTDLNVTLMLAIVSFLVIEISGILAIGLWKYAGKFLNVHSVTGFFIGIIELISELVRIVSFSFRLFGNIFAGEVLIVVLTFFLPFFVPVPLMLFELFVGFIQSAIFAMLTLFFIKIAIAEPAH